MEFIKTTLISFVLAGLFAAISYPVLHANEIDNCARVSSPSPAISEKANIPQSSVEQLTDDTFEAGIANGVVVVDVYAEWCSSCRRFSNIFQQIAEEMSSSVAFARLNLDEGKLVASRYRISSIPTTILFKDGKEIHRQVGSCNAETLKKFIQSALEL